MSRKTDNRVSRRAATAALLFLPGIACNRETKTIIGMVPKGRTHVFWQSVHAGAVAASREVGVELSWNGPTTEADFSAQIQIVESMINRRVSAIALAPIDRKAMVAVVERAVRQQIPVVIFDSPLDTDEYIAQVATDNYLAGQMAADRMAEVLGGKGKVVIVAVMAGAASTMAREQGFEDQVKEKYPGIQILDKRYGNADVAQSLNVAENMLTAHSDLDGIFASNESSAMGAAQAVKTRDAKLKLVGFDSSPALIEDLKAGVIDSLVVQNPFKMGHDSVEAAVHAVRLEPVKKVQNLAPRLIVKADLDKPDVQELLNPDLKKYLE